MKLQNLIHILLGIVCIGLLPGAKAVVPAPDGGYPGDNTAEGTNALLNLTSGINNTAVGKDALLHNTTGGFNVGIASGGLPATPAAALTWPLGRRRSPTTPPTTTWPLVFEWAS